MSAERGRSIEHLFNERMKRWGGRLELPHVEGPLQMYLREVRRYWSLSRPMPYVDYVNNAQANALACTHESQDLIGIFAGLALVLHDAFTRMLAHPSLFPEVGDPSREVAAPPFKPSLSALDVIYDRMPRGEGEQLQPFTEAKDETRRLYAYGLCLMALKFVVQHELGHLLNGHVGYLEALGTPGLEVAPPSDAMGALERQTLEWDADALATKFTIFTTLEESDEDPRPLKERLLMWAISVYTFFHVLYGTDPGALDFSRSHPPPSVRLKYAFMTGVQIAAARGKLDSFVALLPEVGRRCEEAYAAISGRRHDAAGLAMAIRAADERLPHYHREWARLYPLLLPHAKVPLVKPNPEEFEGLP